MGAAVKQATNVLYGQVTVVVAIVSGSVWSATQWTALALDYAQRLGAAWFELYGTPIHLPWRLVEWWFVYGP